MLLTITRWWHCRLCHHEVQLGGAWPNSLCTQRRQCARRPVCLLCQHARAAGPLASPPPGHSRGSGTHRLLLHSPRGCGTRGLSRLLPFLSLYGSPSSKVFLLKRNIHMLPVQPDEFSRTVTPSSQAGQDPAHCSRRKPSCAHFQGHLLQGCRCLGV